MALNAPSGRTFLLMGSGEFEPWSNEIEAAALDGRPGPVAVLPTASSTEGDDVFGRWGRMGLEHYAAAGIDARLVPVKTREDADREDLARELEGAAMVFFSGGKPQHLAETIHGTRLWDALLAALDAGTVYAGCSAWALIASQASRTRCSHGMGLRARSRAARLVRRALGQGEGDPGAPIGRDVEDPAGLVVRGPGRADRDPG